MVIDRCLLDNLTAAAKASPRLRMNFDMRNSSDDGSQRMLNAIEPGSVLPIHRHTMTSETVIILRGAAVEIFYDESGNETERIHLMPMSDCMGLSVPADVWHRIESLETGTVIFESKDGAYSPLSPDDILE